MATTQPPLVADRYRLVEPLGQGGMGRVWKARDEVLHRDVAIKELVPPAGLTTEERAEMRERSLREARAIARLNHVNIVRIFDVLSTDADPWIVMEYVPSRSLQDAINSDGPLEPARVAEIGLGMLAALRAAHRAGVVHRDIKPANVLLSDDDRVVLTDWGLATMPGDPNVTRTGLVLGSPAYIAPERARDGTAGPRSDLWSLGATLYAAVEGHSPFARPTAIATLSALAADPVPTPKRAGALKPVLIGLLRKDAQNRLDPDAAERLLRRAAGERLRGGRGFMPSARRSAAARERTMPAVPAPRSATVDERPSGERPPGEQPSGGTPSAGLAPMPVSPVPISVPPAPVRSQEDSPPRAVTPPAPAVAKARVRTTPSRARENKRALIAAAVALAAVVLAMAALLIVLRGGFEPKDNGSTAGPGPSAGTSAGAGAGAAPSATSSTGPGPTASTGGAAAETSPPDPNAALPTGWIMRNDESGFGVPVPLGWEGSRDPKGRPQWRSPDGAVLLLIDQRRDPQPDPVKDWLNNEAARKGGYRDYHRIAIKKVPYWRNAADWEFTYTSGRGTTLHVLNRGFVTAPDQAYSIYWSAPASQWNQYLDELQTVFDNFRPRR